jgi:hypothetical protein
MRRTPDSSAAVAHGVAPDRAVGDRHPADVVVDAAAAQREIVADRAAVDGDEAGGLPGTGS